MQHTRWTNRFRVPALAGMLAAATFAVDVPAHADARAPQNLEQMDKQIHDMLAAGHVPGASVALVENGKVTFAKGYGYADVARKIPATADTPFRAGSISKSLTAIGIMMLVEQHKLSLDGKLAELAPEVRFVNPWEKTNPVRLVNLLEHTTGWPDISTRVLSKDEKNWSTLQGVQFTSSEFVCRWPPGMFTVYNNAGPAVAGFILEKASGQPFDVFMREHVLRPLGMKTADYDLTSDIAKRIAKSYAADGSVTPYQHIVLKPAGSLNISARELAQLVRFYLFDGFVDKDRLLSPASVARIERSESNLAAKVGFQYAYALGNAAFPDSGITFRGHNGSIDSFTSVLGYNRRSNSGYVLMANGGDGVDFATPLAHMVQRYLTRDTKFTPLPEVKVDPATLARYGGFYRVITPPNTLLRPYVEILNLTYVHKSAGHLRVVGLGNADYLPVTAHMFRRPDHELPNLAFVEADGHVYNVGAFSAAMMDPYWRGAAIVLVVATCLIGALIGAGMLLPWIYFALRGRLAGRGGLFLRVAPLASTVALVATLAMPIMEFTTSGTSGVQSLAQIGPYSLTILVASVLFPLLALAGLVLAIRDGEARRLLRVYVGVNSAALLVAAGYLASVGWFALRTWTM